MSSNLDRLSLSVCLSLSLFLSLSAQFAVRFSAISVRLDFAAEQKMVWFLSFFPIGIGSEDVISLVVAAECWFSGNIHHSWLDMMKLISLCIPATKENAFHFSFFFFFASIWFDPFAGHSHLSIRYTASDETKCRHPRIVIHECVGKAEPVNPQPLSRRKQEEEKEIDRQREWRWWDGTRQRQMKVRTIKHKKK